MAPFGRSNAEAETSLPMRKMTLRVRLFFTGCLVAWMGVSPVRAAGVSCESWNTKEFFVQGGVEDISRCLKTRSPNERNEHGATPLYAAAAYSTTPAVVTALVKAGADVNARDEYGLTPLHRAAGVSTTPAVVTALVKAGADVNARSEDGRTPLHLAAAFSATPSVVAALLAAGSDPAARDTENKTPWDLIGPKSRLMGTDIYWELNEGRFR